MVALLFMGGDFRCWEFAFPQLVFLGSPD